MFHKRQKLTNPPKSESKIYLTSPGILDNDDDYVSV